jgi:ABC-type lipoprotein export system ATPase subunit
VINPPLPTQQQVNALNIVRLKNLKDVQLTFSESPVTALMGTNGCGKTTVLHALACAHAPLANSPNYKFPTFFRPSTDSLWRGSEFQLDYAMREGEAFFGSVKLDYAKAADRWTPRYERRPPRHTRFIAIRESVPEVEVIGATTMVHYRRADRITAADNSIRLAAGEIMDRQYSAFHEINYERGWRSSIGVTHHDLTYSSLSMSAGEQRVFRILSTVFGAPRYSLILIDEIDLFLHQDALERLLKKLSVHCRESHKQLVMTTHFPPVAKMYEDISIQTLHRTPAKTLVWNGYSIAALRYITGRQERPISVFVEDNVAEAIVAQVAIELGLRPFVKIGYFGCASNAFTVGAGIILAGQSIDNVLIVLDGDEQGTKEERRRAVNKELAGTEPDRIAQRKILLGAIVKFRIPDQLLCPEQCIHSMLATLDRGAFEQNDLYLIDIAQNIHNVPERHQFLGLIVEISGEPQEVILSKLTRLAARSHQWKSYTAAVRRILLRRARELNLDPVN